MSFCKNCGEKVIGNYCSHCGQKILEERISFHYIWHEALHFFTHFEKGFLFTSWSMLVKPGRVVTDFVKGKRKIYQPPVSFFLIWITMYLLLLYIVQKIFGENVVIDYKEYFGPTSTTKFAISHLSFVILAIIIHLIAGASVAIIYSDSLKIIYLAWAVTDTIKLFRVKNKVIRIA